MTDFEEILDEIEENGSADSGWRIDCDSKAEWALQKIREERMEMERLMEIAQNRINEYEEYQTGLMNRFDKRTGNLMIMLEEYFKTVPHKATKTKDSYELPAGKLVSKRRDPEIVRDDAALTAWLKDAAPEFVKVKESPDWAGFKKCIAANGSEYTFNGEIVPGVKATPRDPEFCIEWRK